MEERWKEIEGFYGYYLISDFGRIKSIGGWCGSAKRKEKIRSTSLTKDGYIKVRLNKKDKDKTVRVHRLVAEAFIPNLENKDTVNHKDGNKRNNHKSNLEWITKVDNVKHAWKSGLCDSKHKKCEISKDGIEWIKFDKLVDAKTYLESTGAKLANVSHLVRAAKQNEGLETPKYLCRGFYVKYIK